jgi:hypothetical protein
MWIEKMFAANDTPDFPHVCSDQVADVYAQPVKRKSGSFLYCVNGDDNFGEYHAKTDSNNTYKLFVLFRWTSSAHIVYSERLSSNTVNTLPFRYIVG